MMSTSWQGREKHAWLSAGAFMHMHAVRRELRELRAHVGCGSDQDQAAEIHCRMWSSQAKHDEEPRDLV
jgi:hypothetical protein